MSVAHITHTFLIPCVYTVYTSINKALLIACKLHFVVHVVSVLVTIAMMMKMNLEPKHSCVFSGCKPHGQKKKSTKQNNIFGAENQQRWSACGAPSRWENAEPPPAFTLTCINRHFSLHTLTHIQSPARHPTATTAAWISNSPAQSAQCTYEDCPIYTICAFPANFDDVANCRWLMKIFSEDNINNEWMK